MGEVERASRELGMTPQTLRLFLKEGKFGVAVKGTGSRYIYKINWKEVQEYVLREVRCKGLPKEETEG